MVEYFLGPAVWQSEKKRDALHLTPLATTAAAASDVTEERAMNRMKKVILMTIRRVVVMMIVLMILMFGMDKSLSRATFRYCLTCSNCCIYFQMSWPEWSNY